MLFNICICTYKRRELLEACLNSLLEMKRPENVRFIITVIDNDKTGSAKSVVSRFKEIMDVDVIYEVENNRGIPCARNRALDISRRIKADHVVFIDDDERVRSDWFVELIKASSLYGHEAVVHGRVVAQLDGSIPPAIADLFNTKTRGDGQELSACATDNVLVPMPFIIMHGLRFDESRPLAGGTDTMFFTQARSLGLKIYQAEQAIVDEVVPKSRSNMKWLMRRKYRSGLTDAWRKLQNKRTRGGLVFSAVFQIILSAAKTLIFILSGRILERNQSVLRMAKYAGVFMGCFDVKIDSYSKIDK